jgi:hypothetical protein
MLIVPLWPVPKVDSRSVMLFSISRLCRSWSERLSLAAAGARPRSVSDSVSRSIRSITP